RGVHPDVILEGAEVLGERLEAVERDTAQCRRVHALDAGEELDQPVRVTRAQGRHGEPAVPGDDGRYAMKAARGGIRLEGELRGVMRVRGGDAWSGHPRAGVELTRARAVDEADLGDPTARDRHVGTTP